MLRTSAKVNLALEVLGKRGDGYHEIATVLQAVDLFDRLTVETADTLSLHADDPELPTDEGNLVMRAARLLQKTSGIEKMKSMSFFVIGVSVTPGAIAFSRVPAPIQSGPGARRRRRTAGR